MGQAIVIDTSLGTCGFSWAEAGVCRFWLPQESEKALLVQMGTPTAMGELPGWVVELRERVRRHLEGARDHFRDVRLDFSRVSDFAARAYELLREVGPGQTTTYGALARSLGQPAAARALGQAMAANPWPLLVPCHGVLASRGALGGFSAHGGTSFKERLLAAEGVTWRRQGELFA